MLPLLRAVHRDKFITYKSQDIAHHYYAMSARFSSSAFARLTTMQRESRVVEEANTGNPSEGQQMVFARGTVSVPAYLSPSETASLPIHVAEDLNNPIPTSHGTAKDISPAHDRAFGRYRAKCFHSEVHGEFNVNHDIPLLGVAPFSHQPLGRKAGIGLNGGIGAL